MESEGEREEHTSAFFVDVQSDSLPLNGHRGSCWAAIEKDHSNRAINQRGGPHLSLSRVVALYLGV